MTDQSQATPFTDTPVAPVEAVAPVTPAPVADPQPVAQFQIPEAVQGLVGAGMKYATPEDALQSIPHAQHHIERLEEEMAGLREDLSKRKAVEDVLQEINKTPTEVQSEPQFTQEQLDALIDTRLATKEAQTVAQSNTDSVVTELEKVFGDKDKANEMYKQKALDLGLSLDYINNLSATSPNAVFELFGLSQQAPLATKIGSNINSEAVVQTNVQAPKLASVMGMSTQSADVAAWNAAKPTE
jgi:uncharacterized coiled-coil protein SlyX